MTGSASGILAGVDALLGENRSRDEILRAVCELMARELGGYDWVGFYLVDPDSPRELILGPYVGDATDHVRIPFGRGICGQVAESEETLVVVDVTLESNYLSCSSNVRSEIVVPIMAHGRCVGQLDIDSHEVGRFDGDDRRLCESICERLATLFEEAP